MPKPFKDFLNELFFKKMLLLAFYPKAIVPKGALVD